MSRRSRVKLATKRGYLGRGGGAWLWMRSPVFHRGTADQIAGLSPWLIGSSAPMIGVPLGRVLRKKRKGAVVCGDPISWFDPRAGLISNPSAFILGLPGLGKSTLIRRWIMGLDHIGVKSLVLGDLKAEHVELIQALGGQVILVGRGRGYINPLDMEEALQAVKALRAAGKDDEATILLAEARGRRQTTVETLLTINRSTPPTHRESAVLAAAFAELDNQFPAGKTPILEDLTRVVQNPTAAMHSAALSRGDLPRYQTLTEDLESDLVSLSAGHGIGEIFHKHSTVRVQRGQHVVFDVSSIGDQDQKLQAAALLVCWSIGFASVAVGNALADAGLEPQQHVFIVLDELWRALRAAKGLVDLADALTRLNRDKGVGVGYASHTMDDLAALPSDEDRKKAQGMVERCGMVVTFGLPASEMPRLTQAVKLSNVEAETLQSWSTPEDWTVRKRNAPPPGRGKCLIKVGSRRGIALQIELTEIEKQFNRTSKRWEKENA